MTASGSDVQAVDSALQPYLSASPESADEEAHLRDLITVATPVVQSVLRSKLRQSALAEPLQPSDQQELYAEALMKVVRRLQHVKANPVASEPIANFSGYVAVITSNTFHADIRQKYPERQRLRNRVRYVLRTSKRHAVWANEHGETLGGRSAWKSDATPPVGGLWEVPGGAFGPAISSVDDVTQTILLKALDELFEAAGAPIELDQLEKLVAAYLRLPIGAQRLADLADVELVDNAPSAEEMLLGRSALEFLWSEIVELPLRQRAALLLNLRDSKGAGVVSLLVVLGIATFEVVAEAIGFPADELASIWNELPWDDMKIADRLGTTRQQVINLRKSARERLGRRMKNAGRR